MIYLDFLRDNSYKGKTQVWQIYHNESEEFLGEVRWSGGWRQYVFYPECDTMWSRGCLEEIKEFIKKLMDKRK